MSSLNSVHLVGNLVRDPELRETNSNVVTNFTVAWNDIPRNGKKDVAFVDCEAWDKGARSICNNFRRGDKIFVTGRLRTDSWEDKEGNKKSRLRLRVEKFLAVDRLESVDESDEPVAVTTKEGDSPF